MINSRVVWFTVIAAASLMLHVSCAGIASAEDATDEEMEAFHERFEYLTMDPKLKQLRDDFCRKLACRPCICLAPWERQCSKGDSSGEADSKKPCVPCCSIPGETGKAVSPGSGE